MPSYVANLHAFDSHERGILLQWVTGRTFSLVDSVRESFGAAVGRAIPPTAFVAMDYTLDWLYAATRLAITPGLLQEPQPWPSDQELKASPEDVDLLIAWEDERGDHTVLVEAKGFTGWSNAQMASKAKRLDSIFAGELAARFDVHYVLVGPVPSKGLTTEGWPSWMTSEGRVHFQPIADPGAKHAVQRCDAQGTPTKNGYTHWQMVDRKWA